MLTDRQLDEVLDKTESAHFRLPAELDRRKLRGALDILAAVWRQLNETTAERRERLLRREFQKLLDDMQDDISTPFGLWEAHHKAMTIEPSSEIVTAHRERPLVLFLGSFLPGVYSKHIGTPTNKPNGPYARFVRQWAKSEGFDIKVATALDYLKYFPRG